jgi:hypothetical protein
MLIKSPWDALEFFDKASTKATFDLNENNAAVAAQLEPPNF